MPAAREDIRDFLRRERAAVLVEVTGAAGSTPRDTDAWMLVSERAIFATIGAAPVPVPPPSPAVTKTMSAPLSTSSISSA